MENLRQEVMINQFVQVTGATREQAVSILSSSQWQLQAALSQYLEESLPQTQINKGSPLAFMTPANTPATPPNFSDTLSLFSTLSTSGSRFAFSPRQSQSPRQAFSPPSPSSEVSNEILNNTTKAVFTKVAREDEKHNFRVPQPPKYRTRHDSEIQGGRFEQMPPCRGTSTLSTGGGGQVWEVQAPGWRDNSKEMEDFEMEMDN